MKRASAILYSAIFALIAPGTAAVYIPWYITRWDFERPFFDFYGFRVVGILLIALGLPILVQAFAKFAIEGLGTPAPFLPPKTLIIHGPYRFVRNPMYVSVLALICGQAFLFGNTYLLMYGAVAFAFFHLFVMLYEEPTLRHRYGPEYARFLQNVPRWLPRLKPWNQ